MIARELLERAAQRRALASRVLEQHHRLSAPPPPQQRDERFGNQRQTVGFVARRVAARMQDDAEQSERFGAIDLVAHRVDGLLRAAPDWSSPG